MNIGYTNGKPRAFYRVNYSGQGWWMVHTHHYSGGDTTLEGAFKRWQQSSWHPKQIWVSRTPQEPQT